MTMSEKVYVQVEDAIARSLHLGAPKNLMSVHRLHWHYPVGIEFGDIIMRDSDCGEAKPTWKITVDEWRRRVDEYGLWKRVGMWDFARADDEAADAIAYCHRSPESAGRELHRLRTGAR